MNEQRTYVCQRLRLYIYLKSKGFSPYKIVPDKSNSKFNVFLFTATPELYSAVEEYFNNLAKRNY